MRTHLGRVHGIADSHRYKDVCSVCRAEVIRHWYKGGINRKKPTICSPKCLGESRRIPYDRDFFARDNDETAYWAGFLLADGCIVDRHPPLSAALQISVAERDVPHLELFREAIASQASPSWHVGKVGQPIATLTISDPALPAALERWGVIPRKTYREVDLSRVPHTLLPSFIRGFWDGDGCLGFSKGRYPNISATNNKSVCLFISDWLTTDLQILCWVKRIRVNPRSGHETFTIGITSRAAAIPFIRCIYLASGPALERKLSSAIRILQTLEFLDAN